MEKTELLCCPSCKRLIQAKDYMNPAILAFLESVLPTVRCKCGYYGLPVKMTIEDYEKWINENKKIT